MTVADYITPATMLDQSATLAEAVCYLERGEPVFFTWANQIRALTAQASVGFPLSRRLIDLPWVRVSFLASSDPHELVTDDADHIALVHDAHGILGYVDRRRIRELLRGEDELQLQRALPALLHDVANALTVGASALALSDTVFPADLAAQQSIEHSVALVRQMRQLLTGNQEGTVERFDLPELLEKLSGLFRIALGPNVQLEVRVPEPVPLVYANRVQLERVLLNLVLNACEALSKRGHVRLSCETGPAGYMDLFIDDDGPGISPCIEDRVFEAGATTKAGHIRGLGLANVAAILGRMGGSVQLTGPRLGGASFCVRLPCSEPD